MPRSIRSASVHAGPFQGGPYAPVRDYAESAEGLVPLALVLPRQQSVLVELDRCAAAQNRAVASGSSGDRTVPAAPGRHRGQQRSPPPDARVGRRHRRWAVPRRAGSGPGLLGGGLGRRGHGVFEGLEALIDASEASRDRGGPETPERRASRAGSIAANLGNSSSILAVGSGHAGREPR